jgi:hypothetical protein
MVRIQTQGFAAFLYTSIELADGGVVDGQGISGRPIARIGLAPQLPGSDRFIQFTAYEVVIPADDIELFKLTHAIP